MGTEAMAAHGWSSLPADLVNRVGDCLLTSNDLDFYMDLRAVCSRWRSATADPRTNQDDPRFSPTRWVMLHERESSSRWDMDIDTRLFVNTATGRFLRRSLPFLRHGRYDLVASTTGGLLVLAARDSPRAVRVLNPFTGSVVRFAAPMPADSPLFAAVVVGSSSSSPTTLFLASAASNRVYWADPESESFSAEACQNCPASRLPQIAAAKIAAAARHDDDGPDANMTALDRFMSEQRCCWRCYVVEATGGGEMLVVLLPFRGARIDVYKIDNAGNAMERCDEHR